MLVSLGSIINEPLFRSARPKLLAGAAKVAESQVRWVHPSEVVQIASLLHGNEMLLTTGEAVFKLRPEAQHAYLQSLAERGVAALVLEPLVPETLIPADFIAEADRLSLPLYRLQSTVPFVELAEKVNRRIVSDQAVTLQQADEVSQYLARHIASVGPNLRPLLDMIAHALSVRASLVDLAGRVMLESAMPGTAASEDEGVEVATDLFVGSDVAAQLVLRSSGGFTRERLEVIADRLGSIVGLAYAQHYRPSAVQLATTSLLQAVVNGAGENYVVELAHQAQLDVEMPVCLMVFQSYDMSRIRASMERVLRQHVPSIRTYLEGSRLYALQVLAGDEPRATRTALVETLRNALSGISVECCVGPVVDGVGRAARSLEEALQLESFAALNPAEGRVRDASDYALERLAVKFPDASELGEYVREQLNGLLELGQPRSRQLVTTLLTWLDTGCNTTATAAKLYLERQTLHKRLGKIFALIGGDPREDGRILVVHLACRLALGVPRGHEPVARGLRAPSARS
ncbi:PucR family transcriptional regulator [Arthrobacter sp. LS16]|uniref:PucR family transcriptional regulator n=1 Tax=Arthrobacter sp. 'calajunan' TaxID=1690248 RepID=UPI003C7810EF